MFNNKRQRHEGNVQPGATNKREGETNKRRKHEGNVQNGETDTTETINDRLDFFCHNSKHTKHLVPVERPARRELIQKTLERGISPAELKCMIRFWTDRSWLRPGGTDLHIPLYDLTKDEHLDFDHLTSLWVFFSALRRKYSDIMMSPTLTLDEIYSYLEQHWACFTLCQGDTTLMAVVLRLPGNHRIARYPFRSDLPGNSSTSGIDGSVTLPSQLHDWCLQNGITCLCFLSGTAHFDRQTSTWNTKMAKGEMKPCPEISSNAELLLVDLSTALVTVNDVIYLERGDDVKKWYNIEHKAAYTDGQTLHFPHELNQYLLKWKIHTILLPDHTTAHPSGGEWVITETAASLDTEDPEININSGMNQALAESLDFCGLVPGGYFPDLLNKLLDMKESVEKPNNEIGLFLGKQDLSFPLCLHIIGGTERYLKIRSLLVKAFIKRQKVYVSWTGKMSVMLHFLQQLGLVQYLAGINGCDDDETERVMCGLNLTGIGNIIYMPQTEADVSVGRPEILGKSYTQKIMEEQTEQGRELFWYLDNTIEDKNEPARLGYFVLPRQGNNMDTLPKTLEQFTELNKGIGVLLFGFEHLNCHGYEM